MAESAWQLIWHDEFDGPSNSLPDPTKWQFDIGGHGWGNLEWQYYTNEARNASLDGKGCLAITAYETNHIQEVPNAWYGPARYLSARLTTKSLFEFLGGRVEACMKIPVGQGILSAFWLLGSNIDESPWPLCGEIDIMENIGREPDKVYGTIHGPGYSRLQAFSKAHRLQNGQNFNTDFHQYAIEWQPEEIRWFVDKREFFRLSPLELRGDSRWVFEQPFFLVLNVAVGGLWPGYPDNRAKFPQTMLIDYVRVYQKSRKTTEMCQT